MAGFFELALILGRTVHQGFPAYEKIKQFLLNLTWLRAKEIECRELLLNKNKKVVEKNEFLVQQDLHNRKQIEFFVDGFSKLRKRHDDLIERSSQLSAFDSACHSMYLEMAGTEQHFAKCLSNNLRLKDIQHGHTKQELSQAYEEIERLKQIIKKTRDTIDAQGRTFFLTRIGPRLHINTAEMPA